MNVGQIKAYVASLVDDLQFSYFTETELLRYINQAQQEVQKKLVLAGNNWYVKITTAAMVVNQKNYTLPSDFLKMNRVESVENPGVNEDRYPLCSISLNQKDNFDQSADSCAWYLIKDDIYLTPSPKTARILRYYYTYRIAEVTIDADIPDVPLEYHEYLANLVAQRCFLKDGRDPGFILTEIRQVEDNLTASAVERAQDHASMVVVVDDYMGY